MKPNQIIKLITSIIICQLAGIIGSFFTVSSVSTWYITLKKPFFNPPSWVFSPVWITLFVLMGISLYIVWEKRKYVLSTKRSPRKHKVITLNSAQANECAVKLSVLNTYQRTKKNPVKLALTFFSIQLLLNTVWSIIFFGLRSPLFAFIEIIFLWTAILLTIIYFYRISKPAAYLLIPYIFWVSFAAVLNLTIVIIN